MQRRGKIVLGAALAALVGVAVLFASIIWFLWKESVASETAYSGGLAASLGQRTERIIVDTRDMLAGFDRLEATRCSQAHLQAMKDAAISRPYIRAIGYWQATDRICAVGFLPIQGLKPPRADRIYDTGVIAWWPSKQTEALRNAVLALVRDHKWNGKDPITALHCLLVASGHSEVPSPDTLAHLVNNLHHETGEAGLLRITRVRRKKIE